MNSDTTSEWTQSDEDRFNQLLENQVEFFILQEKRRKHLLDQKFQQWWDSLAECPRCHWLRYVQSSKLRAVSMDRETAKTIYDIGFSDGKEWK